MPSWKKMLSGVLQSVGYETSLLFSHATIQFALHSLILLVGIDEKTGLLILFFVMLMSMVKFDLNWIYDKPQNWTFGVTTIRYASNLLWFILISHLLGAYCDVRHILSSSETFIICPWDKNGQESSHFGRFILHFYALALGRSVITGMEFIFHIFSLVWDVFRSSAD